MRILDLFSGAGGAAMGYHRAFPAAEIVGVDIVDQPRYPFTFVRADALTFDLDGFDLVHASPPCHDHSPVTGRDRKVNGHKGSGGLLDETIDRLTAAGVEWIVENVETARFPCDTVRLCGSSFGLDLRRHRKFASSFPLTAPPCDHAWQTPRFRSLAAEQVRKGRLASVVGVHGNLNYAGEREVRERAMRIDWMTPAELAQAIPPAYTEHLGRQLVAEVAA